MARASGTRTATSPAAPTTPVPTPRASRTPRPPAGPESVSLALHGDLQQADVERLRALLDDAIAPGRRLVLDLSEVEHLSSTALAVLVAAHRRLRDGGGSLVVSRPSAAALRVLRVSGLHRVILVDPPA